MQNVQSKTAHRYRKSINSVIKEEHETNGVGSSWIILWNENVQEGAAAGV